MQKWIVRIAVLLSLVVVGVMVAVSMQPAAYHIERSVSSSAPPAAVFPVLSDLRRWGEWSPWDKHDPSMKKTVEGAPGSVGHSMAWEGNDEVGAGKMTITKVVPGEAVNLDLEFLRPFPSKAKIAWSVKPEGAGSKISWSMNGESTSMMEKAFHLFVNMDEMIGQDFNAGLASLKQIVEKK